MDYTSGLRGCQKPLFLKVKILHTSSCNQDIWKFVHLAEKSSRREVEALNLALTKLGDGSLDFIHNLPSAFVGEFSARRSGGSQGYGSHGKDDDGKNLHFGICNGCCP